MEPTDIRDPRALKGWLIIQLLLGVMFIIGISHLAFIDFGQDSNWIQIYNSIVIAGLIAATAVVSAVTCLTTADFLLRVFLLALTWVWQCSCLTVGVVIESQLLPARGDSLNVVLVNAALVCVVVVTACLPTICILLQLRFWLGWRTVGKNEYWRCSGISIAGLLGLMGVAAVVLAIVSRLDLRGIPLEPVTDQAMAGLLIGLATVLPLPWLLRKVLRAEPGLWFALILTIFIACAIEVAAALYAVLLEWNWVIVTALLMQLVGFLPTTYALLWLFRYFGWRLVRGVRLTAEERVATGLTAAWERVDRGAGLTPGRGP